MYMAACVDPFQANSLSDVRSKTPTVKRHL